MTYCPGDRELLVVDRSGFVRRFGPDHRQTAVTRITPGEVGLDCRDDGMALTVDGTTPVLIDRDGRITRPGREIEAREARFARDGSVHVLTEDGIVIWRGDQLATLPRARVFERHLADEAAVVEQVFSDPAAPGDGLWIERGGARTRLGDISLEQPDIAIAPDGAIGVANWMQSYGWQPTARGYGKPVLLLDESGTHTSGIAVSSSWFVLGDARGGLLFGRRPRLAWRPLAEPCGPDHARLGLALARSGTRIAFACTALGVRELDPESMRQLGHDEPSSGADFVAWSPSGDRVATRMLGGPIRIWRDGVAIASSPGDGYYDEERELWWQSDTELRGLLNGGRLAAWNTQDGSSHELGGGASGAVHGAHGELVLARDDEFPMTPGAGITDIVLPHVEGWHLRVLAVDDHGTRALVKRRSNQPVPQAQLLVVDLATRVPTTLVSDDVRATAIDDLAVYAALSSGSIQRFAGGRATVIGQIEGVSVLAASPHLIAAGTATGAIVVWTKRGELLGALIGHTAPIRSLAFSPDGLRLASTASDATLIWDLRP
jgi:hypothetical protein